MKTEVTSAWQNKLISRGRQISLGMSFNFSSGVIGRVISYDDQKDTFPRTLMSHML